MSSVYLPPGWPPAVHPPGSDGFERTAVGWLYDQCQAELRSYEVLRRHPVLLARLAREQLAALLSACRDGYRGARADLRGSGLSTDALGALLAAYEREGRRLAAAARGAELVAAALAGESFTEPL